MWEMWFYPECVQCFGNVSELLCHARHVCRFLRLYGDHAALRAAGRIPESWTPCGKDMAITASNPPSAGTGNITVRLRVLVNIIGRWCVKPPVLVRTLKATSQTKLKDRRPCQLLFSHKQQCHNRANSVEHKNMKSLVDEAKLHSDL